MLEDTCVVEVKTSVSADKFHNMVKTMAQEGVKVWRLIRSEDGYGCFFEGANMALS